jgi:glucose-1-phosphate thymidylyltransferase
VVIPPVYIEDGVNISRSVIGPNVSIAAKSEIQNSVVQDSIINEDARVHESILKSSIMGESAFVKGTFQCVNVGDHSEIVNSV